MSVHYCSAVDGHFVDKELDQPPAIEYSEDVRRILAFFVSFASFASVASFQLSR